MKDYWREDAVLTDRVCWKRLYSLFRATRFENPGTHPDVVAVLTVGRSANVVRAGFALRHGIEFGAPRWYHRPAVRPLAYLERRIRKIRG